VGMIVMKRMCLSWKTSAVCLLFGYATAKVQKKE